MKKEGLVRDALLSEAFSCSFLNHATTQQRRLTTCPTKSALMAAFLSPPPSLPQPPLPPPPPPTLESIRRACCRCSRTTRMTQTRMTQTENDQDDAVGICGDQRSALRALCVVCGRTMPVTKVGVVRVHGPLVNRCTGSGMPPSLSASINTSPPPALPSSAAGRAPNFISIIPFGVVVTSLPGLVQCTSS